MTNPLKIIKKQDFEKICKKPYQKQVWNSISNPWKTYVVKELPIVQEFLKDKTGIVIDLGCGNGRNMIYNKNIFYYGVDFSFVQLKHARHCLKQKNVNAKLFRSRADKLDKRIFKNNLFDFGLFIATLHCLETQFERLNSLKEFYRILKPGAEALISVWNSKDKRFNVVNNHGEIYMSWEENHVSYMRFYYLYKKQEFLSLVRSVGFEILEFYKPRLHDRFSKKNWIIKVKKL
jgi:ubiquinone/menaquinone biosynthesis C-methylase UbiE